MFPVFSPLASPPLALRPVWVPCPGEVPSWGPGLALAPQFQIPAARPGLMLGPCGQWDSKKRLLPACAWARIYELRCQRYALPTSQWRLWLPPMPLQYQDITYLRE